MAEKADGSVIPIKKRSEVYMHVHKGPDNELQTT